VARTHDREGIRVNCASCSLDCDYQHSDDAQLDSIGLVVPDLRSSRPVCECFDCGVAWDACWNKCRLGENKGSMVKNGPKQFPFLVTCLDRCSLGNLLACLRRPDVFFVDLSRGFSRMVFWWEIVSVP